LARPVTIAGSGVVILQLADSGVLLEIPVPTGGPRRPSGRSGRRRDGGRTAPATRRRAVASGPSEETRPRPRARATGTAAVALGRCPLCGAEVVAQETSYGCAGRRDGCTFAIRKTIAGKKIGVRGVQALLKTGRSPVLKGFASKAGKTFDARLKLDGGDVRFDFGP
jgi:DNA topoisomerase-3